MKKKKKIEGLSKREQDILGRALNRLNDDVHMEDNLRLLRGEKRKNLKVMAEIIDLMFRIY